MSLARTGTAGGTGNGSPGPGPGETAGYPRNCQPPGTFAPEAAPYQLSLPSQLADGGERPTPAGDRIGRMGTGPAPGGDHAPGPGDPGQGQGSCPAAAGLAAALRQEGLTRAGRRRPGPGTPGGAGGLPPDPFLARLLAPGHSRRRSASGSWRTWPRRATIRRGQIDLLVFDGEPGGFWITRPPAPKPGRIGRTSSPGNREVPAPTPGLPGDGGQGQGAAAGGDIRVALYFTACRRAVEV